MSDFWLAGKCQVCENPNNECGCHCSDCGEMNCICSILAQIKKLSNHLIDLKSSMCEDGGSNFKNEITATTNNICKIACDNKYKLFGEATNGHFLRAIHDAFLIHGGKHAYDTFKTIKEFQKWFKQNCEE